MSKEKLIEQELFDSLQSDTPYDDAFRTMESEFDDLVIPLVNHMFGTAYGKDAVIKRFRNEHFVKHESGRDEKRVTDSGFEITDNEITRVYHLECESKKYDGTILVRIFEYDSQIAKDMAESDMFNLRLKLPNTGLLLLRSTGKEKQKAEIEIEFPDGQVGKVYVPILKISDYDIDRIFAEKLYMLLPFYIFKFEKRLKSIDKDERALEEFADMYRDIVSRMNEELEKGVLSVVTYYAIIKLIKKVAYNIATKHVNIQRKVGSAMGGQVLDLPEIRIRNEGREEGREVGREEGRREAEAEIRRLREENEALRKRIEAKENSCK